MPKAKNTDLFFFTLPKKNGKMKGKSLISANIDYVHYPAVSLEDLIIFLNEKCIPLSSVNVAGLVFISEV